MNSKNIFVTPSWVQSKLGEKNVKIVDASWCMPNEKKDIYADHKKVRLPNAVLFDIDKICDQKSNLPHMLPTSEQFNQQVSQLGISDKDLVVVYDSNGKYVSSARVWWTFKAFGHDDVVVLEGGLPKWLEAKLPTTSGDEEVPKPGQFTKAKIDSSLVKNMKEMNDNIKAPHAEVLDARPEARFLGKAPEPRAGLKSGHIPGSKSIPWVNVFNASGSMLQEEDLKKLFASKGVDLDKPVITTCGSGVTASVVSLALASIGKHSAVYDGSFSEWGLPEHNNPVNQDPK